MEEVSFRINVNKCVGALVYSLDVKFLNQPLPRNSFLLSGEIILFWARRQSTKLESDLSSFPEPPFGSLQLVRRSIAGTLDR